MGRQVAGISGGGGPPRARVRASATGRSPQCRRGRPLRRAGSADPLRRPAAAALRSHDAGGAVRARRAVATVLADLHDLGIVHGAIGADHILVGPEGHPVLCGFGSSAPLEDGDPAADVRELAATMAGRLGPGVPGRLSRVLTKGMGCGGPRGRGWRLIGRFRPAAPPARAFAAALAGAMADRRLPQLRARASGDVAVMEVDLPLRRPGTDPQPEKATDGRAAGPAVAPAARRRSRRPRPPSPVAGRPAPVRRRRRGPGPRILAVAVVALAVAAATAVLLSRGGSASRAAPPMTPGAVTPRVAPCPPADRGCGPIPVHGGAFETAAGRFAVGIGDAVIVVGRWRCGGIGLPAGLDRRTGRVWAWLDWAGPSRTVTATPVATTSGATTLRVVPGAAGCDRLEVVTRGGRSTVLEPDLGRRG